MLQFQIKINQSGQTLIETVAAMAVAVIMVAALVGLGILAVRTAMTAKKKAISTRLANQAMEATRIYRDTGGYSELSNGCLTIQSDGSIDEETGPGLCTPAFPKVHPLNDDFQYKIEISEKSGECENTCRVINVVVQWVDAGGTHPVELETYLTDWK